jgi:hypothetical protein
MDSMRLAGTTDLRLQVLCKVLSSVYAARFFSGEDQAAMNARIVQHMRVSDAALVTGGDISLVTQVPSWLKLGAVYLSTGRPDCLLQGGLLQTAAQGLAVKDAAIGGLGTNEHQRHEMLNCVSPPQQMRRSHF